MSEHGSELIELAEAMLGLRLFSIFRRRVSSTYGGNGFSSGGAYAQLIRFVELLLELIVRTGMEKVKSLLKWA